MERILEPEVKPSVLSSKAFPGLTPLAPHVVEATMSPSLSNTPSTNGSSSGAQMNASVFASSARVYADANSLFGMKLENASPPSARTAAGFESALTRTLSASAGKVEL